jgi:DMSO/TMAO reductase YedYZ molybdopterin-dependent catalytic subunit
MRSAREPTPYLDTLHRSRYHRCVKPIATHLPVNSFRIIELTILAGLLAFGVTSSGQAQSAPSPAKLVVTGSVEKPLSLSLDDLRQMPRKTLKVMNPHEKKEETYDGVLLTEILKRAEVPQGAQLRGAAMSTYVQADAADGYRVIFSLAELDTDFQDSDVIVADTMDGKSLDDKTGPLRLVVPHDKRPARWIRMLQSLTVVKVPK